MRDTLKYVQVELASGRLPDGKRYVAAESLLAGRAPQVSMDEHASYALGLVVERRYGVQSPSTRAASTASTFRS